MRPSTLVPCLWFDDQAEAAAALYTKAFGDGRITAVSHYPAAGDNPSGKPPGSVLTVELELAGQAFTALNGGPMFTINPTISLFVSLPSAAETRRLHAALVAGGGELMPLDKYPWSECYAWVCDRFGVSWQLMTTAETKTTTIAPCLMFAGAQHGKAEAALRDYTAVFPDSGIDLLSRYEPGEGPVGTLKHGRAHVAGHAFIAMDSHLEHDAAFNEAVSLQVLCADQAEVDRYWARLSEGGEQGPCGWLKDRYGVSWQIVPASIRDWLTSPDVAARDRAFAAMMTTRKPDIAALQAAFTGR